MSEIKLGIFWLCDDGGDLEIIFDIERRVIDCEDNYITYSRQHADVWKDLASKQWAGKYKDFDAHDFPRGRLLYDTKLQRMTIHYEFGLLAKLHEFKSDLEKIFEVDDPKYRVELSYKSRCGRYNFSRTTLSLITQN